MVSGLLERRARPAAPSEPGHHGWRRRLTGRGWRRVVTDSSLRTAIALFAAAKIAILGLAWIAAWIMRPDYRHPLVFAHLWEHWDAAQFRIIAEYGYFGPPGASKPNQAAFFPGYPVVLRCTHLLIPSWTAAEVTVGTVASFFAILGLVRLAEDYRPGTGAWAGVFLLAAPAAVFLSVGYSEALFLAFALPAWRSARHGAWLRAGMYGAAACATRISGLFLLAGLVIMAVQGRRMTDRRVVGRLLAVAQVSISLIPALAYELYLHSRLGDWLAWQHAEERGWKRNLQNPVTTFRSAWQAAFSHMFRTPFALAFQFEVAAVAVLLVTVLVLLWRRRWPEVAYVGLTIASLVAGRWYMSVPRAVLLMFPLWCGLAGVAQRHRWVAGLWLGATAPLMFVTAIFYFGGRWAG